MKIALLEPFFTGSHARWAKEYWQNSQHEIQLFTLKGRHWKWRMYGGAVTLAQQFLEADYTPDLILASDMLDLTTFLGLTRSKTATIPTALYFHENQITYPWSPSDEDVVLKRNNQYGFINYTSALAADRLFFNSDFHRRSFLDALPSFLKQFPDYKNLSSLQGIQNKSTVLSLGLDLKKMDAHKTISSTGEAILLWNHRWEYDKNPDHFFQTLFQLKTEKIPFKLVVLGESYQKTPAIFAKAKEELKDHILHFGYTDSFEDYMKWLWHADILPVTSRQDFFGGSVVEAIYSNCHPILPKRLAYPEHIPETLHDDYFYASEANFYEKLKTAIATIQTIRQNQSYTDFVARYDWSNLVNVYDKEMKTLKTD